MMSVGFIIVGVFTGGFLVEHGHPWFGLIVGLLFVLASLYAFEDEERS